MERFSEQKRADSAVMSMLTEKELPLKESSPVQEDTLPGEPIVECVGDSDNCQKCHSSDISLQYIAGHDVHHAICKNCGYEWVE